MKSTRSMRILQWLTEDEFGLAGGLHSLPKTTVFGILVIGSAANSTIYTDSIFAVIILRLAAPNPIANAPSNHLLRRR